MNFHSESVFIIRALTAYFSWPPQVYYVTTDFPVKAGQDITITVEALGLMTGNVTFENHTTGKTHCQLLYAGYPFSRKAASSVVGAQLQAFLTS